MKVMSQSDQTFAQRLVYDWTSYYWASTVLLAELTDGGTYHERSQYFMRMWVCGINQVPHALSPQCRLHMRVPLASPQIWLSSATHSAQLSQYSMRMWVCGINQVPYALSM